MDRKTKIDKLAVFNGTPTYGKLLKLGEQGVILVDDELRFDPYDNNVYAFRKRLETDKEYNARIEYEKLQAEEDQLQVALDYFEYKKAYLGLDHKEESFYAELIGKRNLLKDKVKQAWYKTLNFE